MSAFKGLNGQQRAEDNLQKFKAWASSVTTEEIKLFANGGQLHRTDLAAHLGFSTSVFRQNPKVAEELCRFEKELRDQGVLPQRVDTVAEKSVRSGMSPIDSQRLKRLQEQNAYQAEEINLLRRRLAKYEVLQEALFITGRLPQ
ncbi:MAG: VPA1267 family protein [Limnobacter sp.]|nr:VPA1267 family protein [Limnobacter sp.]